MPVVINENSPVPKYYQLKEYLREGIQSGRWTPGDQIPTENELIKLCGTSRNTVRQAIAHLANEGMLCSKRALGTFVAQRQATHSIGIGVYDVSYLSAPYFSQMAAGIGDFANRKSYHFNVMVTDADSDSPQSMLRIVEAGRTDGIIILDHAVSDDVLRRVHDNGTPMVLLRRQVPGTSIPAVLVDEKRGIYTITEHLIKLGHKRIGMYTGWIGREVDMQKLEGFREAMAAHGLPVDESLIFELSGHSASYDSFEAAKEFLDQCETMPTAIVVSDDNMATDVIAAVKHAHLRVPDNVAIVGFGDTLLHPARNPSLTTMRIPIEQMVECAADLLFRQISGGDVLQNTVVFRSQLIIRDSCGVGLVKKDVTKGGGHS